LATPRRLTIGICNGSLALAPSARAAGPEGLRGSSPAVT
jgi:hypothetical protein